MAGLSINQSVCIRPRADRRQLTPRTSRKFTVDGRSGRLYYILTFLFVLRNIYAPRLSFLSEKSLFLTGKETQMHLIQHIFIIRNFESTRYLPYSSEGLKLWYYCSLEATSIIEKFVIDDIACVTVMALNRDTDQSGKRSRLVCISMYHDHQQRR